MPRKSFLLWNAVAAIVSSLVTAFGAYAIASAVLGQLSVWRSVVALLAVAAAAGGIAIYRRRARSQTVEARRRTSRSA
jgi:membrane protein DedA with SNARE-associated domain